MPTEIVFTVLPNGRTADRLHLSVLVSPRLSAAGTKLADYPLFLSWPPPDLTFTVVFGGGASFPAIVPPGPGALLWPKLFGPASPVRPYQFTDRSQLPVRTYPITKVAQFLKDKYTKVAIESPDELPAIDDLLADGFDQIHVHPSADGVNHWNQARQSLDAIVSDAGVVDTAAPSDARFDFVQLRDFFAPVDLSDPAHKAKFVEPVELVTPDFHDAVHACTQHPSLLRMLGLVFDLDVDLGNGPVPAGPTAVHVLPTSASLAGATVWSPRTHCEVGAAGFSARNRPGTVHLADGFLRFEDPAQYQVVQVEAAGAGIKAVDYAGNLHRKRHLHRTTDTPSDSALPSLRSDGFAVAHIAHAKSRHDRLAQLAGHEAGLGAGNLELFGDDLVRGYRIDVWDSRSGQWHSVMKRTGAYKFDAGTTEVPIADEACLATTASQKPFRNDVYIAESVFWWDGWSLVGPRPGRTLGIDPQATDPLINRPPNDVGPDFDAQFRFDVAPGTLPFLRYGVAYRFRARTVDLAGNSLPPTSTDATHATAALTFGRFEPLITPPVLLRHPRGAGESMETIVLRSNWDTAPAPSTAERHLAPAKVGQLMVEQHAALDVPKPADPTKLVLDRSDTTRDELAARDTATLLNHPAGTFDPNDAKDNRYYSVEQLDLTYTPDPAAKQLALRFLDGPNAGFADTFPLLDVANGATWPNMVPIRMVVVENTGTPTYDPATHVLTVPVAKADIVHARLSAVLDPADLDQFGLWHWIEDELAPGDPRKRALVGLIEKGQHWMLEPYRPLTLVHAVRQPLETPEFPVPLLAGRSPGDTFATISRRLTFSRKSTSRLDVLATFEVPVDDPASGPPDEFAPFSVQVTDQTAFTLKTGHHDRLDPAAEIFSERHEFGDTKHRIVTYRAIATTRFAEYFSQTVAVPFGGPHSMVPLDTGTPAAGLIAGSVKVVHTDHGTTTPLTEGTHFTVDHSTGVVTFGDGARGAELPEGGTVKITYLAPPITRETTEPQQVRVPSAARPAAPHVLYAVPTFEWSAAPIVKSGQTAGASSTRAGNGLRIYLDRPWWSSGQGELLGVLTWPAAEAALQPELDDDDPLRPYLTQWGMDPIYGGEPTPGRYPRVATFPKAVAAHTDGVLSLDELGPTGAGVNVAGHAVGYDATRHLWYCDIEVDADPAYQPFIRLALARYQPDSIQDAHLSRVVLADFMQLAPGRHATVVYGRDPSLVTVTVTGPAVATPSAFGGVPDPVVAEAPGPCWVIVEQRDPVVTDPELGWDAVGSPTLLDSTFVDGQATWSGSVQLPVPPGQGEVRLVIEQHERLGNEGDPNNGNPHQLQTADRLVYSDIIVL